MLPIPPTVPGLSARTPAVQNPPLTSGETH